MESSKKNLKPERLSRKFFRADEKDAMLSRANMLL
jgi:hypothetical protein